MGMMEAVPAEGLSIATPQMLEQVAGALALLFEVQAERRCIAAS